MDGRTLALMTAGLLGFAAGCTHTSPLRRNEPPTMATAQLEFDEKGALKHKAPTFCAFGDMLATAAFAPDKTPDQRRLAREEAKLSYFKAIETDPKYVPAYISLARVQQAGEEYAAAVETFGKAIQLSPTNATLWYDLGLCQCRMKQWAESVTSLQKACELSPGHRPYLGTLGYTLGRAGRVQEALAVLVQVHGEAKAHYDLARLMRHMDQIPVAKQLAAAALAKDPNLPGAKEFVAELHGQVKPAAVQQAVYKKPAAPAPVSAAPAPTIIQATTTARMPGEVSPVVTTAASVSANEGEGPVGKPIRMPPLPVINARKK
jgi:tetratricopeptide (TPR) repeat protein